MAHKIKNNCLDSSDVSKLSVKELQQELLAAKKEIKNLKTNSEKYKSLNKSLYSEIEEDRHIYKEMFYTSPILKAVLIGPNFIVKSANHSMMELLGKDEHLIGKPYLDEVPELEEQGLGDLLRQVYKTGIPYRADEKPLYLNKNNELVLSYYDFVYQAHRNIDGDICGVVIMVTDVTSRAKLNEELKISNHRFQELIFSSTGLISILIGPDLIIDTANDAILNVWGKDKNVIGKPLLKGVPELKGQGFDTLLLNVYNTGETYSASEVPGTHEVNGKLIKGYYDFIYQAQRDLNGAIIGVAIIANEVTTAAKLNLEVKKINHRFKELIYSSPGLIAILTGDDFIVEIANDAIIEIWGKGPNVIGKSIFTILPEFLEQGMKEKFEEVYTLGKPLVAQEFPIIHDHNGKQVEGYFDFIYQPQKNLEGDIIGVAVIANEVSKTAKLNQKIRESEEKFRQLANIIPDKIANSDENLNTFYYNKSWLDYSGLTLEYLLENGWSELVHPDDREIVIQTGKDSLSSMSDVEIEIRFKDKNGDYKWHLLRATAVKDDNGNFQSWVSATTQIHKIKEEEKRKEEFLKMVSHELKTPVTSIRGYTQLLLSMIKGNETVKSSNIPLESSLTRIDNQTNRLIRLITEMLDLSRIEDSQLILQKTKFNLNELLEHTVQDIKITNPLSEIKIEHDFNSRIFADKERIEQVLVNFITNSIKYSPNSKIIDIKIFQEEEGKVSVSVRDFGIGISKAHIKKIFTRFYRVDGKNEETFSGFGIGLFLVNEIIERHKGTIKVNSKKGKGSEFIFTLNTI